MWNDMPTYKIKTHNGSELLEAKEGLEEGDKGFIIGDSKILKITDNTTMFTVMGTGKEVNDDEVENSYDIEKLEKSDEKQFVLGRVLIPDKIDSDNEVIREKEIEKAAWNFMQNSHAVGYIHKEYAPNANIVESYIAPVDFEIGDREVKKGTWLVGVKIDNKRLWEEIKKGKMRAFSVGGWTRQVPVDNG